MVEFDVLSLDNSKNYKVIRGVNYAGCDKAFKKASENLLKFVLEGRPVSAIIPRKALSKEEKEEYRKFFCKKAQEDRMNYIYFEDTVSVEEYDPMEGTMFEDF